MGDTITQAELDEMRRCGAEIEIDPDVVVVEGLVEQLSQMVPAPVDNSEVLGAIRALVDKLDNAVTVQCEPIVESTHHSHNENKIVVDTTPILEAVERLSVRSNYQFSINRDDRGRIESMDARII
ncbi:hypothetical protein OAO65_02245 [Flavobacteriales bacterium]|nr:hypothetical protein [Flavobacteriales bacterium]